MNIKPKKTLSKLYSRGTKLDSKLAIIIFNILKNRSKRSFDVFYVDVCMIEDLIGGAVWIFRFGGASRVGVPIIQATAGMSTRVVSGEDRYGGGEG